MINSNLKEILRGYEVKRNREIAEAGLRKQQIYKANPRLEEIDFELA